MAASIGAIVSAVSAEVVTVLATMTPVGGVTPGIVLGDGGILVGPQQLNVHGAPPRIVFVPEESPLAPKNLANPSSIGANQDPINAQRSLFSKWLTFSCYCWGASVTRNDAASQADDYDAAMQLSDVVMSALVHQIGPASFGGDRGILRFGRLSWVDDDAQTTRLGRKCAFQFSVSCPVLDTIAQQYPTGGPVTRNVGVTYGNDPPVPVTT